MEKPLVSLIIPCYNGEKYLEEFLSSLFAQDYPRVEIIFVDDGSADRTGEIYKNAEARLPSGWTSRYIIQPHAGQAAAVSLALKYVTGDLFMWSDADDIMTQGSISKKADFLIDNPGYLMVRNDFRFYYCDSVPPRYKQGYGTNKYRGEDIFEGLFDGTLSCLAGTYMMRTSLITDCYPDRTVPLSGEGQNFQLLLPAASRSKCGFIGEALMDYRIHPDSHSNRPRSITQQFKRAEGFLNLRLRLLDYCICDRERYTKLAYEVFEQDKKAIVLALRAGSTELN